MGRRRQRRREHMKEEEEPEGSLGRDRYDGTRRLRMIVHRRLSGTLVG